MKVCFIKECCELSTDFLPSAENTVYNIPNKKGQGRILKKT